MRITKQPQIILIKACGSEAFPKDFHIKYHTHIFCQGGSTQFIFNDRPFVCKQGDFIFWLADNTIAKLFFSKNFKATILFVDKRLLSDNFPNLNTATDAILHHRVNPILHPEKVNKVRILKNFQSLYSKSLEINNRFYDEALKLQMQLFLLEMWDIFMDQLSRRNRTLLSGTLYERFVHLLELHCMKNREVQFYSSQLHITAKYLNQICKANTGITASQWIQRYAKDRIVLLLNNKNLNVSEISDEMGFSSHSFFTRYVKKLLGASPTEYRNRLK